MKQDHNLRIRPRDDAFLDRKRGIAGEIFFDKTSNSLRCYDGGTPGGFELARSDLENIPTEAFDEKLSASNAVVTTGAYVNPSWIVSIDASKIVGASGGTVALGGAVLGDSPPVAPVQTGTIWFNTSTGKLYIYYDDGTSLQWVQPMTPSVGGGGGGGGNGTVNSGLAGKLAYYSSAGTTVDDLAEVYWHTHGGASMLHVDGLLEVSGQKNKIRFHWDTLTDLNNEANPTTWHGMIAHVHETGRVYFAHSGAWTPLANFSDVAVTGLLAGNNVTISNNSGVYTINAVVGGGGGGITLDEAQDGTASLFSNGTQTGITFVYNDAGNSLSATVGTVALGTGTSGNYVASVQTGSGITGGSAGSEGTDITLAIDTAVVSTLTGVQTLTNKTIAAGTNTISGLTNSNLSGSAAISNANLANSSITINGTSVSLGGTVSISTASTLDGLTDVTITTPSPGQVLKYNGSTWINDVDATTGGAGVGTVTTVSVVSANGFTGTVATASSTPAITIATSITGLLKGNGTAISAATAGTDYQSAQSVTGIVKSSGTTRSAAVAGTDYQAPITLTTTGSSGAATFSSGTLNIPQYTSGASAFTGLSDASSASLTVDKFYLPAITKLTVTASGTSAYLFDQYAGNNPTIYAISGTTIAFDLGTGALSSHPFVIRYSGADYNTGLTHVTAAGVVTTGASAQDKQSGTLYWKIPAGISGTYGYLCRNHGGMAGVITIKDISVI